MSHDATAATFASSLMSLSYAKSDSSVYTSGAPITVSYDTGATLCSTAGTTSSITFKKESGALPSMDVMVNQITSTGGTPAVHFKTTQTLTCTCAGVCGGR